jgi:hypothetical protein
MIEVCITIAEGVYVVVDYTGGNMGLILLGVNLLIR